MGIRTALAAWLAMVLAMASPASAQDAIAPGAREAVAVVDAFHAALKRGDTIEAAALLANDVLIFESGGVERTKAEYATRHLPADAEFAQATSSVLSHRNARSDGTVAWIASEGRTTGEFRGKAINSVSTETMVLSRANSGWRIVHIHWSSAAVR
jgi:ketosteroid isomerase-like protein